MANMVDASFFTGELNVPNTNRQAVVESLDKVIKTRQAELLRAVLGIKVYNELVAAIATAGVNPLPAPWLGLMDGEDYEYNEVTYNWMGIVNKDNKQSIVANYAYYWFLRKDATNTTGVGESLILTDNASRTSPMEKQTRAYNQMLDWLCALFHYMTAKAADFPSWNPSHTNYCQFRTLNKQGL